MDRAASKAQEPVSVSVSGEVAAGGACVLLAGQSRPERVLSYDGGCGDINCELCAEDARLAREKYAGQSRQALIAEFMEKQYWQFISLDEWLDGNARRKDSE